MQSVGAGVTLERVGIDILGPLPRDSSREPLHPGGRGTIGRNGWRRTQYPITRHLRWPPSSCIGSCHGLGFPSRSTRIRDGNSRGHCSGKCVISCRLTRPGPRLGGPCSNGLVENFNRTLGAMLRQMTSKHQQDWDEHIDLATMAYRSTVHDSTGQTPNRMMLGERVTHAIPSLGGNPRAGGEAG